MEVKFRTAMLPDLEHVAEHLCAGESTVLGELGFSARDVVFRSAGISIRCEAAVRGEQVLALIGLVPMVGEPGVAILWMLATDAAFDDVRTLVRLGRRYVSALEGDFPHLIGFVDERHVGTIKWLRLLGFAIGEPMKQGARTVCPFERDKRERHARHVLSGS